MDCSNPILINFNGAQSKEASVLKFTTILFINRISHYSTYSTVCLPSNYLSSDGRLGHVIYPHTLDTYVFYEDITNE